MIDSVVWLPAAILASLTIIGIVARVGYSASRLLLTIEDHTRQLTANDGSHIADAVRRTEAKVDDLKAEQTTVAAELETHRGQTAEKFAAVWEQIATRDINKAAAELHAAAERAEAVAPPRVEN